MWRSIGVRLFSTCSLNPSLKMLSKNSKYSEIVTQNKAITYKMRSGDVSGAERVFSDMVCLSIVSFNAMLSGYLSNHRFTEARKLFDKMPHRDLFSWNVMVSGFARNNDLKTARELFDRMPERDVVSWTAMVSAYVHHGSLEDARRVFDEMPDKDSVSWDAMIAGYVQSKDMGSARELFEAMPCKNVCSWNTMLTGYARIGDVERARSTFASMGRRDSVSWAAMVAAYAQNGLPREALGTFVEMLRCGERLDQSAYTCALGACAEIGALELGKQLHGQMVKSGFENDCYLANALLVMYSKCGCIGEAYDVFQKIGNYNDIVSWNAMISGFARHGFRREALALFDSMMAVRIVPDEFTMVGVLLACSHTGLVEIGTEYFNSMKHKYGITPGPKHYNCMIHLLGRAGRLDEAQDLMKNMPFEPGSVTWRALLGACMIHGNTELGEKAAKKIYELELKKRELHSALKPEGRWSDAQKMKLRLRDSGVKKVPGYSWVEV